MVISFHALMFDTCRRLIGLCKFLQIKNGDIRVLANTSFLLVKKNWSSEIRLHAFKMLQVQVHMLYRAFQ